MKVKTFRIEHDVGRTQKAENGTDDIKKTGSVLGRPGCGGKEDIHQGQKE
jgi:hypothetical protein